jgi:hypothetical protein
MSLKIPTHLILTQKQKEQLNSLPISNFVNLQWGNNMQEKAIVFLQQYNLILENILPEYKWKTCYSDKAKGIYVLQCCCGSDMSLNTKKSNSGEAKTRKSRKIYEFISCFAFARIKKHEGLYISIFGYLNHLEDCQRCLPVQPPPLCINETVKLMAQNLLQINVHPSHILDDNMDYVNRHLGGKVLIDNERYLLSNQDIINIRNLITKDLWGIDKRKAEEININQLFGPNSKDNEIMEATIYYKPQKELNDWFILVLATKEQRELA